MKLRVCPRCGGPMREGRAMCPACAAHCREAERLGRCPGPGHGRKPLPVRDGRCLVCGRQVDNVT